MLCGGASYFDLSDSNLGPCHTNIACAGGLRHRVLRNSNWGLLVSSNQLSDSYHYHIFKDTRTIKAVTY